MSKKTVTTEYTLTLPKLRRPLRLALVSDLHERRADDILERLRQAKPDCIAVTGDTFERFDDEHNRPYHRIELSFFHRLFLAAAFNINYFLIHIVGKRNLPDIQNSYRFLREAAKLAPVWLSLGNHEEKLHEEDLAFLKENRITLLDNADVEAEVKGQHLHVGGLSTAADSAWLARFAAKDGFKLLLCHHPEYFDRLVRDLDIDLTLSGHNHGGQIRVFGRGVLSSHSGLFPKYDKGVFENRLVLSAGCSNTAAIPRLNNPRELVIIDLKPENKTE